MASAWGGRSRRGQQGAQCAPAYLGQVLELLNVLVLVEQVKPVLIVDFKVGDAGGELRLWVLRGGKRAAGGRRAQ